MQNIMTSKDTLSQIIVVCFCCCIEHFDKFLILTSAVRLVTSRHKSVKVQVLSFQFERMLMLWFSLYYKEIHRICFFSVHRGISR